MIGSEKSATQFTGWVKTIHPIKAGQNFTTDQKGPQLNTRFWRAEILHFFQMTRNQNPIGCVVSVPPDYLPDL